MVAQGGVILGRMTLEYGPQFGAAFPGRLAEDTEKIREKNAPPAEKAGGAFFCCGSRD